MVLFCGSDRLGFKLVGQDVQEHSSKMWLLERACIERLDASIL